MSESKDGLLDFGLTQEELQELEESSRNAVCEGGDEGWAGQAKGKGLVNNY